MANQRRLGAAAWLVTATCALAAGCGGSDGNVFSNPDAAATSDADAADSGTTPTDSGSSGGDTGIGTEGGTDAGVCPATVGADLYVAPTGSDTTGNGSATCPFVTITKALSLTTQSLPAGALRWTVNVQSGSAAVPNLYGTGCTAGIGNATRRRFW